MLIQELKKNCSEGNHLLGGDLHAIRDKIEADMLQITTESNRKWII